MEKVWRDYKHKQQHANAGGENGGGAGPSELHRRRELSSVIEELGIDAQDQDAGSVGIVRKEAELNSNERKYLLAAELGDMPTVRMLIEAAGSHGINVNCRDSLGRSAIHIAIEFEHVEMLEMLLMYNLELGDALLHAIQEENVLAVELLLSSLAEKQNKKDLSGLLGASPSSSYTPDITPIILAAHIDNYEIIKILLGRGDRVPKPHEMRCACADCVRAQREDSLRHSKSRINAFKALASPSLISLSSKDPILTAFELSWEMKRLGRMENEFKKEYEALAIRCQEFATALLEQTRSSDELAIVLNHELGQDGAKFNEKAADEGERLHLARLKLAIKFKQKRFVAHPHCQQLLAALWYEGLPGFRRKHLVFQVGMIGTFAALFPALSTVYLMAPKSDLGQTMRKPFIKFICHSASYLLFLGFLVLAAIRVEDLLFNTLEMKMQERGAPPSSVEWIIIVYVLGFVWQEVKQLWSDGAKAYVMDMWNLLDFTTNALYIATITLRTVAWYRVKEDASRSNIHRKFWDAYDPTLISECLFATANIFSMLKLVYMFTINPHLGPLQISLGRMLSDILKFFCVVLLVLISFACGFNQLYWFYAYERNKYCSDNKFSYSSSGAELEKYNYCVTRGRHFSNLFEISQSLYWSTYGLIDLANTDLEYQHSFTEFVGKLMYGAYSAITFIVLLNMLIAMMNCSYESIATQADIEWKFHRSKLWVSYFDEGGTLPVPFNIIPSPKSFLYLLLWVKDRLCSCSKQHQRSKWQSIRKVVKKVNEREARYQSVMRDLIRRYLMVRQRADEKQGVTEDDLNEIKGDISAFRFELLEILRTNGMKTPAYAEQRATKLRRRGSKRSMQSRRFGPKFNSIGEENNASGDDSLDESNGASVADGWTKAKTLTSQNSNDSCQSVTWPDVAPRQQQKELPLDARQLQRLADGAAVSSHQTQQHTPPISSHQTQQHTPPISSHQTQQHAPPISSQAPCKRVSFGSAEADADQCRARKLQQQPSLQEAEEEEEADLAAKDRRSDLV